MNKNFTISFDSLPDKKQKEELTSFLDELTGEYKKEAVLCKILKRILGILIFIAITISFSFLNNLF